MTDSAYENARNQLIPAAEKAAEERVYKKGRTSEKRPGIDGDPYDHFFFTEYFHAEMNRLAEGLR